MAKAKTKAAKTKAAKKTKPQVETPEVDAGEQSPVVESEKAPQKDDKPAAPKKSSGLKKFDKFKRR